MKASEYYMNQILGGSGGGGITPTGEINITENGNYDVTSYASAEVDVPQPSGTKTISITENGTTTEDVTAFASAEITVDVPTGGGGTEAPENDVIFYDYDGTRLYSYSASQFANLTAMPANPDRTADGLTAQGWNWSLADAKAYVAECGMLDIGQMYITTSGATEIDVELSDVFRSPCVGLCVNGSVEVDWGDKSEKTVITGSSITSRVFSAEHAYSMKGSYTIKLSCTNGTYALTSVSNYPSLLFNGKESDVISRYYRSAIKRIRIGENVLLRSGALKDLPLLHSVSLPDGLALPGDFLRNSYSIEHINIPKSQSVGSQLFQNCYSMYSVSIPKGLTLMNQTFAYSGIRRVALSSAISSGETQLFRECRRLSECVLPDDVVSVGTDMFVTCSVLQRFKIPTAVTNIPGNFLNGCTCLTELYIPSAVSNIGSGAFGGNINMREYHFESVDPPTLASTSVFNQILSDCIIYVPAESLEAYQTATNWSTYASQMQGE